MTKTTVQHYVSIEAERHVITRARIIHSDRTDDVSLFSGDRIVGTLSVEAGKGEALCEQLQLIERGYAAAAQVSLADVAREFKRVCSRE